MHEARPNPTPGGQYDEDFAERFKELSRGRSVGGLREDMAKAGYSIGANAIQAARRGSRGIRLETLQKFADYFGIPVKELIGYPPDAQLVPRVPAPRIDSADSEAEKINTALILLAHRLKHFSGEKRKLLLDAIAVYAADPEGETAMRNMIVHSLAPRKDPDPGESVPTLEATPKSKAA